MLENDGDARNKIRVALLFASPYVTHDEVGIKAEVLIDYREEFKWSKINSYKDVIQIKTFCATEESYAKL